MAVVNTQKSPQVVQPLKAQPQDSPTTQFGRYGLYRILMHAQQPHAEAIDPISHAIMSAIGQQKRSRVSTMGAIY